MGLLEELIGVNSQQAFNFFMDRLKDSARMEGLRDDELLYVTSILAHYAQTSRYDMASMPAMSGLTEVFDNFLMQTSVLNDAELLEFGGSQVLVFAGFFRDQMRRRHNVEWYDHVGQSLYERAGQHSTDARRRELFDRLSESFPVWTGVCSDMHRGLRENRFLLKLD